jgi:hypothetical protein
MQESGLFERILKLDEHPGEIQDIFQRVDEATKNFGVYHFTTCPEHEPDGKL